MIYCLNCYTSEREEKQGHTVPLCIRISMSFLVEEKALCKHRLAHSISRCLPDTKTMTDRQGPAHTEPTFWCFSSYYQLHVPFTDHSFSLGLIFIFRK